MDLEPEYLEDKLHQSGRGAFEPIKSIHSTLLYISTHEDPLEFLDTPEDTQWSSAPRLVMTPGVRLVLTTLDPSDIVQNFEPEVLPWAEIHSVEIDDKEKFRRGMSEYFGYDTPMFVQAQNWQRNTQGPTTSRDILGQYSTMMTPQSGALSSIDLGHHLETSAYPNVSISAKRAARYDLKPLRLEEEVWIGKGWEAAWGSEKDGKDYGIFLDTPSGVALTYKGAPQAVIAFAAHGSDGMMVHQLQGVRGEKIDDTKQEEERVIGKLSARGLNVIDWQNCMLDIAEDVARLAGKTELLVQPGVNNPWTVPLPREKEPHITLAQAEEAYDVPAKRLGFERNTDGDWVRPITAI